jgi:hypothetical protein
MSEENFGWRMPCKKWLKSGRHRDPCAGCLAVPHLKPVRLTAAAPEDVSRETQAQTVNIYNNCLVNVNTNYITVNIGMLTKETTKCIQQFFGHYFDNRYTHQHVKSSQAERAADPVGTFIKDLIATVKEAKEFDQVNKDEMIAALIKPQTPSQTFLRKRTFEEISKASNELTESCKQAEPHLTSLIDQRNASIQRYIASNNT